MHRLGDAEEGWIRRKGEVRAAVRLRWAVLVLGDLLHRVAEVVAKVCHQGPVEVLGLCQVDGSPLADVEPTFRPEARFHRSLGVGSGRLLAEVVDPGPKSGSTGTRRP